MYYLAFKTKIQGLPVSRLDIDHTTCNMSDTTTKSQSSCVGTDHQLHMFINSSNHAHSYYLFLWKAVVSNMQLMWKYTSQILDAELFYYQMLLSIFVYLKK